MNDYIVFLVFIFFVILIIMLFILGFIGKFSRRKISAKIINKINYLISRYNEITIGMDETTMLTIMEYKYDKLSEEDKTTYRFIYITKGGSGTTTGIAYNGTGGISGYSESHDESSVTIECKNNKVTKILPYNMNNIMIPCDYGQLITFAATLGINYKQL